MKIVQNYPNFILIGSNAGGRNRRVSEAYVTSGKTIEELEKEMLNGQKLQGPPTAKEVNFMLKAKKMEEEYVHEIERKQFGSAEF